ncbi:hypothetical protein JZ751_007554 [Albula glossodonta]|uniref:Uncharacterized protein n=1 Tax=Albula glossodonta TaxID=121402 RepID=A0A8T2MIB7_9TELE|nr:hypothetical protein JZ751_016608 [Albula glossodonta]KAG9334471.1 hypothetical protein JZ751_007554 [Albula glossodonta]
METEEGPLGRVVAAGRGTAVSAGFQQLALCPVDASVCSLCVTEGPVERGKTLKGGENQTPAGARLAVRLPAAQSETG